MCYESDSVEDAAWNEVPEHCLKLYWWQGPPHKNKVKQYEIVVSFKVSLFIHVLYRHENKEFILFAEKNQSVKILLSWSKCIWQRTFNILSCVTTTQAHLVYRSSSHLLCCVSAALPG